MLFAEVGPFKAFLPGVSADDASPELDAMIRFAGGFMVILGCMLVTVRWNTINGKLSGMAWSACPAPSAPPAPPWLLSGCPLRPPSIGCAGNLASVFGLPTSPELSPPQVYAALMALAGLHLMFNANPVSAPSPPLSSCLSKKAAAQVIKAAKETAKGD